MNTILKDEISRMIYEAPTLTLYTFTVENTMSGGGEPHNDSGDIPDDFTDW